MEKLLNLLFKMLKLERLRLGIQINELDYSVSLKVRSESGQWNKAIEQCMMLLNNEGFRNETEILRRSRLHVLSEHSSVSGKGLRAYVEATPFWTVRLASQGYSTGSSYLDRYMIPSLSIQNYSSSDPLGY